MGRRTHERSGQVDGSRFDEVVRLLGSGGSRRPLLGAGLAALTAAGLSVAQPYDSEGKGKKGKKKKKKCKRNTKKCGKKCIPADQCCTSADCGNGGQCTGGKCSCPTGQKSCNGGCISQSACCTTSDCGSAQTCVSGACTCPLETKVCGTECLPPEVCCSLKCPGEQTCVDGFCECESFLERPCPDGSCVSGIDCCDDSQCSAGRTCVDGICFCEGANAITCGELCCDAADDEICVDDDVCTPGGCQGADWCNDIGESFCRDDAEQTCVCQIPFNVVEPSACLDRNWLMDLESDDCTACSTSAQCDTGYVCIPTGQYCDDCPGDAFCALTCDAAPNRQGRGRGNGNAAARERKPKLS